MENIRHTRRFSTHRVENSIHFFHGLAYRTFLQVNDKAARDW